MAPPNPTVQVLVRSATAERYETFPVGMVVSVGRHTTCQLRLESDTISRQHAVLELLPDGLRVEDVSTNGTMAGETLLRRESLVVPYGTTVTLGEFELVARLGAATATGAQVVPGPSQPIALSDGGPWGGPSAATAINPMRAAQMAQAAAAPQAAAIAAALQQQALQQQAMQQQAMQQQALQQQAMQQQALQQQALQQQALQQQAMQQAALQRAAMQQQQAMQQHQAHLQQAALQQAHGGAAMLVPTRAPAGGPGAFVSPPSGFGGTPAAGRAIPAGALPAPQIPGARPQTGSVGVIPSPSGFPAPGGGFRGAASPQTSSAIPVPPGSGAGAGAARGSMAPARASQAPAQTGQRAALTGEALERRKRDVELRRRIHKLLLEHLDLATMDPSKLDDPSIRPRVLAALRRIVAQVDPSVFPDLDRDVLVGELADEALGLGPLERFLSDPAVSEIMVVDPETIYVERGGKLVLTDARFTDDDRVRAVIERIVTPLGRRIDESSPIVDARLKDGSRVNAVIRPLALRGSCITIRKFARTPLTLERLIELGTLTPAIARFLTRSVLAKKNIVISGGTGSGKTTLLNVLSGAIPSHERIVTIEDAAELQLKQPHVVSLETRPPNMEGRGEYTIRDLVKNALRMRPDRIVVGECRGGEALDMLQAMNTGHDGSLTTTHANTPEEAAARLETLALMSGLDLPSRAIREQIAGSIHLIVQQSRLADGSRKITAVSEVTGLDDAGAVSLRPIFEFVRTGTGPTGQVIGEYRATGYLPSYLNDFIVMGLIGPGESYL